MTGGDLTCQNNLEFRWQHTNSQQIQSEIGVDRTSLDALGKNSLNVKWKVAWVLRMGGGDV
jgi:Tfp pilus assembly ATPase PilU